MSTQSKSRSDAKVVIERTYRASIHDVWELWTTKDGFESWWGPQGFRAEVHELDARVGGALRYDMIADTTEMIAAMKQMGRPTSHATQARFSVLEPREHLVITSVIDFLPNIASYEADIDVALFSAGESVRMVVTLDAMHSDEFTKMQKEGFSSQLTKLDKRFAKGES
jgi:uncharacterized protein YndB with AHSA1/START domain